jgi:hypothetical protein
MFESIVAISVGIGLAAACGFRVFLPMLVVGLAARAGLWTLADGFSWMGTWPAIATFATATVLETGAYYLPWLDNVLDLAFTPAAVLAGVLVSGAFVHDLDPLLQWSLALVAGGGASGVIKTGLVGMRLGSTALTGGTANPLMSTLEWTTSAGMSILSIFFPLLALALALVLIAVLLRFAMRLPSRLRAVRGEGSTDVRR